MENKLNKNLKGKDILLLLLYLPGKTEKIGEGIFGATRLTKAFFLFEEEVKTLLKTEVEKMPEFISWKYGPWSRDLFDYIEFFEQINFIKISVSGQEDKPDDLSDIEKEEVCKWQEELLLGDKLEEKNDCPLEIPNTYSLTEIGERYVKEKIIPSLSSYQVDIIREFKRKINTLSLYTILKYVYKKYGKDNIKKDWTDKSEITSEVLK